MPQTATSHRLRLQPRFWAFNSRPRHGSWRPHHIHVPPRGNLWKKCSPFPYVYVAVSQKWEYPLFSKCAVQKRYWKHRENVYHLMVAYFWFQVPKRTASAFRFNTSHFHDLAVIQQWENWPAAQTTHTLNMLASPKHSLFLRRGLSYRPRPQLTTEMWRWIDITCYIEIKS